MSARLRSLIAATALVSLVWAGVAVAGMTEHFEGKAGKAVISLDAKANAAGKAQKITKFVWDSLKCGNDVFTGGTSKAIKVKNGKFKSTQQVAGVSVPLKVTVTGRFSANGASVRGRISIRGGCTTPKTAWHATKA
jgi:hypothetical protein